MRLHSGAKPYKCEFCERHFRQWGDLKYHITSIHTDQKQFQCEYCGKDFARKYSLIVHRRIHTGEKNYICEFCHKSFRASSYLQNHRRIHTGELSVSCLFRFGRLWVFDEGDCIFSDDDEGISRSVENFLLLSHCAFLESFFTRKVQNLLKMITIVSVTEPRIGMKKREREKINSGSYVFVISALALPLKLQSENAL